MVGSFGMVSAEILHGASPIDIGEQSVIAEAQTLHGFRRSKEEDVFQRGGGSHLVDTAQEDDRPSQAGQQEHCGGDRDSSRIHFRLRRWKINTAPHSAMVA